MDVVRVVPPVTSVLLWSLRTCSGVYRPQLRGKLKSGMPEAGSLIPFISALLSQHLLLVGVLLSASHFAFYSGIFLLCLHESEAVSGLWLLESSMQPFCPVPSLPCRAFEAEYFENMSV